MIYRTLLILSLLVFSLWADAQTALITGIARDAIVEQLTDQKLIDKKALIKAHPFLAKEGATFVTLNKEERLRGCIGSLKAYRPLLDDMVSNAKSAAFSDSRFMALNPKELSRLQVEVSLLTPPERIDYSSITDLKSKVIRGQDGIVLETFFHKATYLPQVWKDLPHFNDFFHFLCQKAGLKKECLEDHPTIYRYRVHKYSEKELTHRPTPNAGSFYPDRCTNVEHRFASFRNRAQREHKVPSQHVPRALIVPHAGYVFSGYTADLAYRSALKSRAKRIILIGPSHYLFYKGVVASHYEALSTPCGIIRSDEAYLKKLRSKFKLYDRPELFEKEHSTEVQLPFINHYLPQMKVVELVYSNITVDELSKMMVYLLSDPENLLVISSDLSHFYTQQEAKKRDFICLDGVEERDSHRIKNGCEACGKTGIEALVKASKSLNLQSELLDYRTSEDASGDTTRVVGYMSAIFW